MPVSYAEDVYEKCQDLRKIFKVSVSLAFASAIDKYLDELISELEGVKDSDNYSPNYILLFTSYSDFSYITLLWDMIETEELIELMKHHAKT